MHTTRACALSTIALLMLLSGCATAPIDCPRLPEPPARVPLGENFQDRMQQFLSGTLPTPVDYSLHSAPARTESGTPSRK